jgi:hypothetical protein
MFIQSILGEIKDLNALLQFPRAKIIDFTKYLELIKDFES